MVKKDVEKQIELMPKESSAFALTESPSESPMNTGDEVPQTIFTGVSEELMAQLTPAKVRTILLWITGQYTKQKIAKIIGVGNNTIGAWLLDPVVQQVIRDIQGREFQVIESSLKAMRFKALDTMNDLLDSDMDNVRFSAAKDILDRGGHKAQQSIKVEKTVTNLEQQLSQLADFTIDDAEVIDIDIDDIVSEVKGER